MRLDVLLEAADELAKDWLLALLRGRPLSRAPEIPLARFASDAPDLCAAVLRGVASDAELDRLRPAAARREPPEPGWDLRALAGARDAPEVIDAVEALRYVLWCALTETLSDFVVVAAGRVANRLAHVCSALLARSAAGTEAPGSRDPIASEDPALAAEAADDEHAREATASAEESDRAPRIEMQQSGAERVHERELEDPWSFDDPETVEAAGFPDDVSSEIDRHAEDGERLVVLLIEVVGFERLRDAEGPEELDDLLAAVQRALANALGAADRLAPEGSGRWWLVARGAGEAEGRALAELLARGVSASVAHRRVPLKIAIGVAASPEDGHEAADLAERAEEELYSARSAGVSVLPASTARAAAAAPASDL